MILVGEKAGTQRRGVIEILLCSVGNIALSWDFCSVNLKDGVVSELYNGGMCSM